VKASDRPVPGDERPDTGHSFEDPSLLAQALTHPSALARGRSRVESYERLEFLGDRVLGLVVADMLYRAYPDEEEGALARRHSALVCRDALARVAGALDLGDFLTLSRGEEEGGGRRNPAVLADACEALIGALYLDGGLGAAEAFIRRHWSRLMQARQQPPRDAKTALQEWAQGEGRPLPAYETVGVEGPDHAPTFCVRVRVEGLEPVTANGPSKRAAEQAAAERLLSQVAAAGTGDGQ
jgi:ribonuclease III